LVTRAAIVSRIDNGWVISAIVFFASVQARLSSTRLPGKVLLSLGCDRIFDHVLDRCEAADRLDVTAVTTGNRPENEAIVEFCQRRGTAVTIGPEDDLLERHLQVAREMDREKLVRITADCPFVPPQEIDRVIAQHLTNESRYTTNVTDEMPVGTAVDVIEVSLLEELSELGETHPIARPRNNPDDWQVTLTPNKDFCAYSNAHTAVDTPEDYWTLVDAVDTVGTDPYKVTKWVAENQ
jgi:spore coat polysaccharide biosynthesis protein SpsF